MLEARDLLSELTTALRSRERVSARGVLLARRIITDGCGPLYAPNAPRCGAALAGLGGPARPVAFGSMDRPVIGLCTALERARWSVWDQEAYLLPRSYVDAVQRAGGIALMLPPDERAMDDPDALLDLVDGLVLAGGADIDPDAYGSERHTETVGTVPERDTFEIALTRRALERDLPLLGICRGMQLMNVARGGTLLPAPAPSPTATTSTAATRARSTAPTTTSA